MLGFRYGWGDMADEDKATNDSAVARPYVTLVVRPAKTLCLASRGSNSLAVGLLDGSAILLPTMCIKPHLKL